MTKIAFQLCIFLSALLLSAAVLQPIAADTYRWVDDNGIVNYAERKPRGVPESRITRVASITTRSSTTSRPGATDPASAPATRFTPQTQAEVELTSDQQEMLRGLQQAESDRQAQVAQIKRDNCERSRRVLSNLTAKDRIRVRSETGIERVMPEDERQEKIAAAQRGIVENCDA
ncbi:MAG: DUF4124 domain-containing protein [bacterium]